MKPIYNILINQQIPYILLSRYVEINCREKIYECIKGDWKDQNWGDRKFYLDLMTAIPWKTFNVIWLWNGCVYNHINNFLEICS